MATTTTNLGLTKPDYTDAADIAVINTNMDTVDTAITETKSDLGIVEDGNTATHSITSGQYVIWKGNLCTASSAIAIGTTLSTSNLTAVSNGGLNSLNSNIVNIDFTTVVSSTEPSYVNGKTEGISDNDYKLKLWKRSDHTVLLNGSYKVTQSMSSSVMFSCPSAYQYSETRNGPRFLFIHDTNGNMYRIWGANVIGIGEIHAGEYRFAEVTWKTDN